MGKELITDDAGDEWWVEIDLIEVIEMAFGPYLPNVTFTRLSTGRELRGYWVKGERSENGLRACLRAAQDRENHMSRLRRGAL